MPATVSVLPVEVRVIAPAAPPLLLVDTAALLPEVLILPTVRLPAVVNPVVVRVTAPPAVAAVELLVSIVTPVVLMVGADKVNAAPPVVTPVIGSPTVPIVKAALLEKLTTPVALDAKVPTLLIGTAEITLLSVKLPDPASPRALETTGPVSVTAPPAASML